MTKKYDEEQFGEFKGSTSTKLDILFSEIKELRTNIEELRADIEDLKGWKAYTIGFGAAAGFLAGIFKDIFFKRL